MMKIVFMSLLVVLSFSGCRTDRPPSEAQVFNCAPVFKQVEDLAVTYGFGAPITNTMPRSTLLLVDGTNRMVVPFVGHRLQTILDTNTVYMFTIIPMQASDHRIDLPRVFQVRKNGRSIYRYTDEMRKF